MKRHAGKIAAACLIFSVLIWTFGYGFFVKAESNVDMEAASSISIGTSVSGTISTEGEEVWYKFTTPDKNAYYSISASTAMKEKDFSLDLLDAEGASVDSVTFNTEESGKMCYKLNKKSTYYVQVCMFDTETSGKFSLKVAAISDDFEDTLETATAMTLGNDISGKFEVAEDRDYAWMDTSDSTQICEVIFTNMDLESGAEIALLDEDEIRIESMYAEKGETVSFTVKLEKNSRYYFYMAAAASEETGKYKIRVNATVDNAGDTIESATPFSLNQVMSGAFEMEGDEDYLTCTTSNRNSSYEVSLTNQSVEEEITLLLTSEDGAIEGSLVVTKGASDSFILQLEKNTNYYISLFTAHATGTYSFKIIEFPEDDGSNIEPTPVVVSGNSIEPTPVVASGNSIEPTPVVASGNRIEPTPTFASDNVNGTDGYFDKDTSNNSGASNVEAVPIEPEKKVDASSQTVKYTAPRTVKLNKKKLTLKVKKKATLKVSVTPAKAVIQKQTWTSSKTKVATVTKKGVVKAKKKGTTMITCKITFYSGKTKTVKCKVTVK